MFFSYTTGVCLVGWDPQDWPCVLLRLPANWSVSWEKIKIFFFFFGYVEGKGFFFSLLCYLNYNFSYLKKKGDSLCVKLIQVFFFSGGGYVKFVCGVDAACRTQRRRRRDAISIRQYSSVTPSLHPTWISTIDWMIISTSTSHRIFHKCLPSCITVRHVA